MTVRINKQKINLREKLTEFEDKVNFDEVVRGLGEYDGNVGIGIEDPVNALHVHGKADGLGYIRISDTSTGSTATDGARIGYNSLGLRIQNYENTNISFFTNNSTEALTIQNDGNVGIGTTSPSNKLSIEGAETGTNLVANNNDASIKIQNLSDTDGNFASLDFYNSTNFITARIGAHFIDAGDRDTALYFATRKNGGNLTQRMTIDEEGDVGIGTDSPTSIVSASTGINAFAYIKTGGYGVFTSNSTGPGLYINKTNASTSETTDYINFRNKGLITGSIEYDGADVNIVQASDARLKENIQDSESGLNLVNNLKVRSFDWVGEKRQSKKFGFVAQEMHEVFEEAVKIGGEDENESPWGVFDSKLIPVLTKAIQEQQAIIEDLKSRIKTLESK